MFCSCVHSQVMLDKTNDELQVICRASKKKIKDKKNKKNLHLYMPKTREAQLLHQLKKKKLGNFNKNVKIN